MKQTFTITAVTRRQCAKAAAADLSAQLRDKELSCVVFFCSAQYELAILGDCLARDFGEVPLYGCTTAGEITPLGYEQHTMVAIGFKHSHFNVSAQLITRLDNFDLIDAQATVNKLQLATKDPLLDGSKRTNQFMLTLLDGLAVDEELFLNTLNSAAGNIKHFGGSAGDDIHLAKTHVYYQGTFHQHSAIVIMFNTRCVFEVFSTNHVHNPQQKLVVTEADSRSRTIYELNAEPAALEYAKLLNLAVEDLTPQVFSLNPLAVKIGGNYYFRSIQKVNYADNSLTFYCAVDTGIVLTAVELGDVFENLNNTLKQLEHSYGAADIVLACDCFLRRLEVEHNGFEKDALKLFSRHNIIGFNTYGEHINGVHLNQTFTAVYIGGASNV